MGRNTTINQELISQAGCHSCNNFHGHSYGGNYLNCAIHPYQPPGEDCPDWEKNKKLNAHQEEFLRVLANTVHECSNIWSRERQGRPLKFAQDLQRMTWQVLRKEEPAEETWVVLEMRSKEVKSPKYPFFDFSLAEQIQYRIWDNLRYFPWKQQYAPVPSQLPQRYWYWHFYLKFVLRIKPYTGMQAYELSHYTIWRTILLLFANYPQWFVCTEGKNKYQVKVGINPLALKEELVEKERNYFV